MLLLDEPLSNLDAKLRLQMRQRAARACTGGSGITTIFVTHDQEEAMTICEIARSALGVVARPARHGR